jgi:ADP-heptose:LPS heptosyltransferase
VPCPRIPSEAFREKPRLSRGHLTRRIKIGGGNTQQLTCESHLHPTHYDLFHQSLEARTALRMKRLRHLLESCCSIPGAFLLRVTNALWRLAREPQLNGVPRNILIVKLDEIGDFVLASPFLRELKRSFPGASITLVVSSASASLAKFCPYANVTLAFEPEEFGLITKEGRALGALLFAKRLQAAHFDLAIIPRWDLDLYTAYHIVCGSRVERIIGYTRAFTSVSNTLLARTERRGAIVLPHETPEHETLRNLRLVEAAGGSVQSDHLEAWLSPEDRRRVDVWLTCHTSHAASRPQGLVAFGIGAGVDPRRWPEDRFAELSRHLVTEFGVRVVLVGAGQDDVRRASSIMHLAQNSAVLNAVGQFNLRETAALLERCQLFIGNDSGPMHLAAAVRVPVVEICGLPLDQDSGQGNSPTRFRPWGVPFAVVRPESEHLARQHEAVRTIPLRIDLISVAEVARAAAGFLPSTEEARRSQPCSSAARRLGDETVRTSEGPGSRMSSTELV